MDAARRRREREPVAYITGWKGFRHLDLAVDRRVLIPRPETELLVEVGLTLPEGATVVDVGTGSGAVALALKHERPDLRISAVDSSRPALDLARENAHHLALDVHFAHSDLIAHSHLISDTDSTPEGRERFYAIVANLPYVPDGIALPPEVAEYEPAAALFGGVDGLDVIRRLLGTIDRGVNMVALEVGFDQAERVSALVCSAGFARIERLRDLAGHERVIVGWR
jgi:release factor glutamine methyltransferase